MKLTEAEVIDLEQRRERAVANAAALGLTPGQYARMLVDALCQAIQAKRVEGQAILAERDDRLAS